MSQIVIPTPGMTVEILGVNYRLVRRETDASRSLYGCWEAVQETGHPANVGNIQWLGDSKVHEAVNRQLENTA